MCLPISRGLDVKRPGELTGDKAFGLILGAGRVMHNEFHAAVRENRLDLASFPFERPQTFDPWGEMGGRRLLRVSEQCATNLPNDAEARTSGKPPSMRFRVSSTPLILRPS